MFCKAVLSLLLFPQGPDEWETLNGNWSCNGRKQSPINVATDQVMQKDPINPTNLRLTVAGGKPITGKLVNNGYAPTFYVGEELTVKLAGGLLEEKYYLKQFHFHFGCNDSVGSEHSIDGNTYPIEVKIDRGIEPRNFNTFLTKKTVSAMVTHTKSPMTIAKLVPGFFNSK